MTLCEDASPIPTMRPTPKTGSLGTSASLPSGPSWSREQEELLRTLREAARVDETVFAHKHAISVAQLRALEGRGHSPFYSEAIKARLGLRLLASLGHPPAPSAIPPVA